MQQAIIIFMYMQAALLTSSDVAIGLSHSGYSAETAHTLKIAKQNGATTVALTHSLRSPVTEYADYVLVMVINKGSYKVTLLVPKLHSFLY